MNQITLVGNLTRDPELRFTPNGNPVAEFGIAVTKMKAVDKDEWISDFFNCVIWGTAAENVAKSLNKGSRVILTGKLTIERWEKDNEKKQATKIRVMAIGPELSYAICKITKNAKQPDKADEQAPPTDEDIPF
jgi:single-strand DNA-binding protein